MGVVTATRPQPGQGVFGNPGLLAAGAAGCVAAALALWSMRGLPLGTVLLWFTACPLFIAGLGFGLRSGVLAAVLATLLVGLAGNGLAALIFLTLFGLPVPLLLAAGLRPGGVRLGLPLALLGLWPVLVLLLSALFLADDGGLEAAMRGAVAAAMAQLDIPSSDVLVNQLVRVKAAAIGFWAALALLVSAAVATRFLDRRGLMALPQPVWSAVRLPQWYPILPALAAGGFLLAPTGGDAVPLSALLMLVVPLFLQGIAGIHARLHGRKGRVPMLAGFYVMLLLFLQVMGPGLIGLGLFDQFRRRAAPRNS